MRTLLKYAKTAAIAYVKCVAIAYPHKTDMPNYKSTYSYNVPFTSIVGDLGANFSPY